MCLGLRRAEGTGGDEARVNDSTEPQLALDFLDLRDDVGLHASATSFLRVPSASERMAANWSGDRSRRRSSDCLLRR